MHHLPPELSGGEQQRVAVARALVARPDIVLADEPSGNLDDRSSEELHRLFWSLRDRHSQAFAIVTHDESLADRADRKLRLHDGLVREEAPGGAPLAGGTR
jgi:lipoprotein-releasing system ATP-binding protein